MPVTTSAVQDELHDPEQLKIELARYPLRTSSGTAELTESDWLVVLSTDGASPTAASRSTSAARTADAYPES